MNGFHCQNNPSLVKEYVEIKLGKQPTLCQKDADCFSFCHPRKAAIYNYQTISNQPDALPKTSHMTHSDFHFTSVVQLLDCNTDAREKNQLKEMLFEVSR